MSFSFEMRLADGTPAEPGAVHERHPELESRRRRDDSPRARVPDRGDRLRRAARRDDLDGRAGPKRPIAGAVAACYSRFRRRRNTYVGLERSSGSTTLALWIAH